MPNFEFIASIIELAMDRTNSALLKRYIIQNLNILLEVKVAETQSVLLFWDFRTSSNVDNALNIKLPLPTNEINLKVDRLQMHETWDLKLILQKNNNVFQEI